MANGGEWQVNGVIHDKVLSRGKGEICLPGSFGYVSMVYFLLPARGHVHGICGCTPHALERSDIGNHGEQAFSGLDGIIVGVERECEGGMILPGKGNTPAEGLGENATGLFPDAMG